jgi:hypothetical protein
MTASRICQIPLDCSRFVIRSRPVVSDPDIPGSGTILKQSQGRVADHPEVNEEKRVDRFTNRHTTTLEESKTETVYSEIIPIVPSHVSTS